MAVINAYVNTLLAAGRKEHSAFVRGGEIVALPFTFEVAAADDNASIYRIAKDVSPDLIPVKIDIFNDAITAGTDYDLGLYEPLNNGLGGAVISATVLANTLDMSSAAARSAPKDGLENLNIDKVQKRIYEIAGHTLATRKLGYDIAFTANTVGTAAGTISGVLYFVKG